MAHWLEKEHPAIKKLAKEEDAEIHWGDETGFRSDDQRGRGYAPKGKTPVVSPCAKRHRISLIATVTNQGKVRFMLYRNALTAALLIAFMTRLIRDTEKKSFSYWIIFESITPRW